MKIINNWNKRYIPLIILAFFAFCGFGILFQSIGINILYDPIGLISTIWDWLGERLFISLSLFSIAIFPIYLFVFFLFFKKPEKLKIFEKGNPLLEWMIKIFIIIYFLKFISLKIKVIPFYLSMMEILGLSFPTIVIMITEGWIPIFFFFVSLCLFILLFVKKISRILPMKNRWLFLFSSFYLVFITNEMIQIILLNPIQQMIQKM
jgi:hypothetical protein